MKWTTMIVILAMIAAICGTALIKPELSFSLAIIFAISAMFYKIFTE